MTRYKGVDVTPHTFGNLIKTITDQRSVVHTSTSKTKFENKIREIIFAFNPNLKQSANNKSTEYLLINSLKVNDNKQITHTYNYNTWDGVDNTTNNNNARIDDNNSDSSNNRSSNNTIECTNTKTILKCLSRDAWDDNNFYQLIKSMGGQKYVKNIKKRFNEHFQSIIELQNNNDEEHLKDIKKILNLKKFSKSQNIAMLTSIQQFLGMWLDDVDKYNNVESFIHGIRLINDKLKEHKSEISNFKTIIGNLEIELQTSKTSLDNLQKINLELKDSGKSVEALNKHITSLKKQCEDYQGTINFNVAEIAKLGANMGEKDVLLEELAKKLNYSEASLKDFEKKWVDLDEQNNNLLKENSLLKSKIKELEDELNLTKKNNNMYESKCYELLNQRDKDNDDHNKRQQEVLQTHLKLKTDYDNILHDKHLLTKQLQDSQNFYKNLEERFNININQLQEQCHIKEREIQKMDQDLTISKCRLSDIQNEFTDRENNYISKMDEYLSINTKLKLEIEKLKEKNLSLIKENENCYDEGCSAMEEKCKLLKDYNKLKVLTETQQNEFKTEKEELEKKIKMLEEDKEEYIKTFEQKLTNQLEQEHKDKEHELQKKFELEKRELILELTKKNKPFEFRKRKIVKNIVTKQNETDPKKQRLSAYVSPIPNSSFVQQK